MILARRTFFFHTQYPVSVFFVFSFIQFFCPYASIMLTNVVEVEANIVPQLLACNNPDPILPHADDVNTRLGNLEQQLQQLLNISRSRSTSRNSSRSRSRSRSHSRSRRPPRITNGNPSHCWYHQQFGNQARKCTPPCSFANQGNPQAGQ